MFQQQFLLNVEVQPTPWVQLHLHLIGDLNLVHGTSGQTVFLNGLQAGDCNTVDRNGRPWCYVNFNGIYSCGDETRAPVSGFYVSYNACDLQRDSLIAVPYVHEEIITE